MDKIKVGIVNYLNTRPLLYGITHSEVMAELELVQDFPAIVARNLLEGTIDLGLVPVAVIPQLKESYIIGDYGIGANGAVASVCLLSEVPMEEIEEVLLDYQSRTSTALVKILFEKFWKKKVRFVHTEEEFANLIKGSTAGLIIGDRCLQERNKHPYIYDLGEAWKSFTGLPFVFACWVSNHPLPQLFIKAFNEANRFGLTQIDKIVTSEAIPGFDLKYYYNHNISYELDEEKRKGLSLFLDFLKS